MGEPAVLVVGATGQLGGRLVPQLPEAGCRVRAFSHSKAKLKSRPWALHPLVDLAEGNVESLASLQRAAQNCWAGHYLAQGIEGGGVRSTRDARAARNQIPATVRADMKRIISLGGVGDEEDVSVSGLLRSRREANRILRSGPRHNPEDRHAPGLG